MGKKRKVVPHPDREKQLQALAREINLDSDQTKMLLAFSANRPSLLLPEWEAEEFLSALQPTRQQLRELSALFIGEGELPIQKRMQRFQPPQPDKYHVETALHWLNNPNEMLTDLTTALNDVVDLCSTFGVCHAGGKFDFQLAVRPEHHLNSVSSTGKLAGTMIVLYWDSIALAVRNSLEQTPFSTSTLENFRNQARVGEGRAFSDAFETYRKDLQTLADWIAARKRLNKPKRREPKKTTVKRNKAPEVIAPHVYNAIAEHVETYRAANNGQFPTMKATGKAVRKAGVRVNDNGLGRTLRQLKAEISR